MPQQQQAISKEFSTLCKVFNLVPKFAVRLSSLTCSLNMFGVAGNLIVENNVKNQNSNTVPGTIQWQIENVQIISPITIQIVATNLLNCTITCDEPLQVTMVTQEVKKQLDTHFPNIPLPIESTQQTSVTFKCDKLQHKATAVKPMLLPMQMQCKFNPPLPLLINNLACTMIEMNDSQKTATLRDTVNGLQYKASWGAVASQAQIVSSVLVTSAIALKNDPRYTLESSLVPALFQYVEMRACLIGYLRNDSTTIALHGAALYPKSTSSNVLSNEHNTITRTYKGYDITAQFKSNSCHINNLVMHVGKVELTFCNGSNLDLEIFHQNSSTTLSRYGTLHNLLCNMGIYADNYSVECVMSEWKTHKTSVRLHLESMTLTIHESNIISSLNIKWDLGKRTGTIEMKQNAQLYATRLLGEWAIAYCSKLYKTKTYCDVVFYL